MDRLTPKQRRFVEYYDGNAAEAAEKAGYAHPRIQAARLLTNVNIKEMIQNREERRMSEEIATREERKRFLTEVIRDEKQKMHHRLRATELLCRTEGDFLERHQIEQNKDDWTFWDIVLKWHEENQEQVQFRRENTAIDDTRQSPEDPAALGG